MSSDPCFPITATLVQQMNHVPFTRWVKPRGENITCRPTTDNDLPFCVSDANQGKDECDLTTCETNDVIDSIANRLRPRKHPRPQYEMAIFLDNLDELPVPVLESPFCEPPPPADDVISFCSDFTPHRSSRKLTSLDDAPVARIEAANTPATTISNWEESIQSSRTEENCSEGDNSASALSHEHRCEVERMIMKAQRQNWKAWNQKRRRAGKQTKEFTKNPVETVDATMVDRTERIMKRFQERNKRARERQKVRRKHQCNPHCNNGWC